LGQPVDYNVQKTPDQQSEQGAGQRHDYRFIHDVYEVHVSVLAVYAHRVVSEPEVPALGPAVVHAVSGMAGALRIGLFDDAVLNKKSARVRRAHN